MLGLSAALMLATVQIAPTPDFPGWTSRVTVDPITDVKTHSVALVSDGEAFGLGCVEGMPYTLTIQWRVSSSFTHSGSILTGPFIYRFDSAEPVLVVGRYDQNLKGFSIYQTVDQRAFMAGLPNATRLVLRDGSRSQSPRTKVFNLDPTVVGRVVEHLNEVCGLNDLPEEPVKSSG